LYLSVLAVSMMCISCWYYFFLVFFLL